MLGLAEALCPDLQTRFLSFSEGGLCGPFLERCRAAGFDARELPHDFPRLVAAWRDLVRALRQAKADVLCCHGYKADLLGLLAARRLGIPVIAVSRGWTGEGLKVRLYEALDRRVLRWVDKVVCVSHGQAAKVRAAGVPEHKIAVIHNAVRPERFADPEAAYVQRLRGMFRRPPRVVVGAAGRLSPEKGFDVLVDAASRLAEDHGGVGVVVFGEGPMRGKLEARVRAACLGDRFLLPGFTPELDRYLPCFDVLAVPSFTEGLPNVALEALAAGVPVVATAVGGTPEVIEHGVTGLLVPPGEANLLADGIACVLSDAPARERLSRQGRLRVAEKFSFAAQARRYGQLLGQLAGSCAAFQPANPPDPQGSPNKAAACVVTSVPDAASALDCRAGRASP